MELFSFSRLNTFTSCPRRFYYKYILGWDDPVGLPAIFGKTVHKAIELYLNGRYFFDDAIVFAWIEEANMSSEIKKADVERQVRNALSYSFNGKVENHFVMQLGEGVKLQGYIDLAMSQGKYPRPAIVDWKTGRNVYEVLANWQIPLYAAHIMEKTEQPEVLGMLAFLRFNRIEKAIITREIAQQAKEWALKTARDIQERLDILPILTEEESLHQVFAAKPSWLCGYCPWSYQCLKSCKASLLWETG